MKKSLLFSLVMGCAFISHGQAINQNYPNKTQERLKEKNFYLFSAMENDRKLMELLKADEHLNLYWDKMTSPLKSTPKNGAEITAWTL